ncbi:MULTISPECIES: AraC family transcriptional regulator [unclassified Microbulbifer]|uniref:GlxA family transcriptional regulator n=1 Tax=unclassified Microbulbifer TaxID=2619833 RepID=UPI0027E51603|nr:MULTISPECIES: AraC family transcriptional regulator [unclassified Microbulbifer]
MKNVYILIYEDVVLSSAAAPLDIFMRTNDILTQMGRAAAFEISLVAQQASEIQLGSPASFACQRSLKEVPPRSDGHNQNLILVPAFAGEWDLLRRKSSAAIAWLKRHYEAGTEIASLCKGSYFLAEAGLLEGKACTSHWAVIDDMRQRFPKVDLQPDSVLTDQNGIYTGGGAFSSLNLILYLVEKFCGHDVGVQVAKNFSIHRDHMSQAHFSVFSGLNRHGDKAILNAQNFIEEHYGEDISIEQVASHVNMSKRNFIRRFKQAVQVTPIEYIQRVKIEAAKKALESGKKNIQALTYEVGYNDSKTFRSTFKRLTGVTPQDYRNKYGRL